MAGAATRVHERHFADSLGPTVDGVVLLSSTLSRPRWPAPRPNAGTGSAPRRWRSTPRPAPGWLPTRLAPDGAATIVRNPAHRAELERVVLSAFTTSPPCQRKGNHPPGAAARAEAARLLASLGGEVSIDLNRYAELAEAAAR